MDPATAEQLYKQVIQSEAVVGKFESLCSLCRISHLFNERKFDNVSVGGVLLSNQE